MWLPAIAILPRRDAPLVDPFLLAVAVIHSSGAARLVRDTVWGLQEARRLGNRGGSAATRWKSRRAR